MASAAPCTPSLDLTSPELLRRVAELRRPNNLTNWLYLARECLAVALIVGGTIASYHSIAALDLSWCWAVPLTLLTIVLVGAWQHRLATLAHEASHYSLFRNRLLNELVSDWFCMFPLFSSTHSFRLQHLGHHQYPNDPKRDPDLGQLQASGHRFRFPMSRGHFLWHCVLKQMLFPPLPLRYILVRAIFRPETGPYRLTRQPARLLKVATIWHVVILVGATAWLIWHGEPWLATLTAVALLAVALAFFALAPERFFAAYVIKSDVSPRCLACLRSVWHTLLVIALGWLTASTGEPWWLYYFVLWVVPLGTSFPFFMMLRQLVQHGNADEGRLTNTRIFRVNPLISGAVFPLGMDYHLPHHLFPMVPHYRLRQLHALLQEAGAYREGATVVEGYFVHRETPPTHPTVLDVMTQDR